MPASILNIIFFPEISLTILTVILLLIGLFQKENSFKFICNLSVIALLFISFLILLNQDLLLSSYKSFFKNSSFIQFFKILIILSSLASIIISKYYFPHIQTFKEIVQIS